MLITTSLVTGNNENNENSSFSPRLLSPSGRPLLNIMNHLVLDVRTLLGGQMTFSTGHVRLWEKGSSWPQEPGQKPLPLGKVPKISEVHCKAVKFLASEDLCHKNTNHGMELEKGF